MKQIYLGIFAVLALGLISVGSAYALDTGFVENGNLNVDQSSTVIASDSIGSDDTYVFSGDHTISGSEFFNEIVNDNDELTQRVRILTSSGSPDANGAPSQQGAKITIAGHEYLSINGSDNCSNDGVIYRTSSGNITVEGRIGSGTFTPTYMGHTLETIEVPDNPGEDCEWNRIIIDLPTSVTGPQIIEQTEDEYYRYVTYRIPK